jgi:hypothetical protein
MEVALQNVYKPLNGDAQLGVTTRYCVGFEFEF